MADDEERRLINDLAELDPAEPLDFYCSACDCSICTDDNCDCECHHHIKDFDA